MFLLSLSTRIFKPVIPGILLLSVLVFQSAEGQRSNKIDKLSVADGLSSASVLSIVQDSEGYLWVGTILGLNRFDGKKFARYFHSAADKQSIPANTISCLEIDSKGDLWIGTDGGGVCRYNKYSDSFDRFDIPPKNKNSKDNNRIWALEADNRGNIWVGSYGDGLSKIDTKTGRVFRIDLDPSGVNLSSLLLQDILCDSSGTVWIATDGAGMIRFDPLSRRSKSFTHRPGDPLSISHNFISRIKDGGNGIFWVTTYGRGICEFNSHTGNFNTISDGLIDENKKSGNEIWSALYEPGGTLWLGYWGRGLAKYNTLKGNIEFITDPSVQTELGSSQVLAVFRDRSDVLWVGTSESGLIKITDPKTGELDIKTPAGKYSSANLFYQLPGGKMLVGTEDGLLLYGSDLKVERVIEPGAINKKVTSIIEYGDNYWIGTLGSGIFVLNRSLNVIRNHRRDQHKNALSSNDITAFLKSSDSTLWIGTFGEGLNRYDKGLNGFSAYRFSEGSQIPQDHDKITGIREIRDGKLILSTFSYGLCVFDMKSHVFKAIEASDNIAERLPFKIIYSMIIDNSNVVWCATLGGLLKLDLNTFKLGPVVIGQEGNSMGVFSVLENGTDDLLVTGSDAIYKFNKKSSALTTISSLRKSTHRNFLSASAYRINDNVFYGTDKGFVLLDLKTTTETRGLPQITLSGVWVNDLPANFRGAYFREEEFVLSGDDNRLQFTVAMFDYRESSAFELQYKLEGLDGKWRQTDPGVPIVYSNISPGAYKFRFRVVKTDGTSREGSNLLIEIKPPFYMTWWFILLIASSVSAALIYTANSRIQRIKKQRDLQREYSNLLIESQEQERKRISSELHDSIGQNLAVIKNLAVMQNRKSESQTDREKLDLMIEVCSEAIDEVRKIAYDLRPYQIGKTGLTKAIEHLFDLSKKAGGFQLEMKIENIDSILSEKGELHIYRILQECLNNSMKYSGADNISLRIMKNNREISVEYSDNGSGFSLSKERAFEGKGGLGIMDIRERSKILSGDLSLFSEPGKGFKMDLRVPITESKHE